MNSTATPPKRASATIWAARERASSKLVLKPCTKTRMSRLTPTRPETCEASSARNSSPSRSRSPARTMSSLPFGLPQSGASIEPARWPGGIVMVARAKWASEACSRAAAPLSPLRVETMKICTGRGFCATALEANGESIAPGSPISLMSGLMQAETPSAAPSARERRAARKKAPTPREAAFIRPSLRLC